MSAIDTELTVADLEAAEAAEGADLEAVEPAAGPAVTLAPGDLTLTPDGVALALRVSGALLAALQEQAAARPADAAREALRAALADTTGDTPLARWRRLQSDLAEAERAIALADATRAEVAARRRLAELKAEPGVAAALLALDAEEAATLAGRSQAQREREHLARLVAAAGKETTASARRIANAAWQAEATRAREEWESLAARAAEALEPLLPDLLAAQLTAWRYHRPLGDSVAEAALEKARKALAPPLAGQGGE